MADSVAGVGGEGRERGLQHWIERQAGALARADRTRLIYDVFYSPSIGPVAAWLVGGLIALVGWLTVHYAPGALVGACGAARGGDSAANVISQDTARWTLFAVIAFTLTAGAQPVLEKRFSADWAEPISDWFARQSVALRAPVALIGLVITFVLYIPAWAFSLADYLLARPIALIAGAALSPFWLRYGVFVCWMAVCIVIAWTAPAPFGLYGFFFGVALVLAMVRRWNWVERDREAFFVARQQDPDAERIGFAEDLRDEALVAIVFLFVLIPLGLRQLELAHPDTFCINGGDGAGVGVLDWLTFFGAELAKSVPFVDWSEVFHVANGSPIEPNTVLGAQVVFAMRATLDLLMLAAVTQAVQLASRLAEQNTAFAAGKVNILEPFVERTRLHALGVSIDKAGAGKVIEQKRVAAFPPYSPDRLEQIVKGGGERRPVQAPADAAARRAALALAAKQAVGVGRPEEAQPIIGRAKTDPVEANRRFAMQLAYEIEPGSIMQRAFARANEVKAREGAIDIAVLLQELEEYERPLAQRAIRSAMGELDVMVPIPAGKFMMGAPEGEKGAGGDERPLHAVEVAAFEIGKYAVTFEEFDAFCEATGYWRRQQRADEVVPPDQGWGRDRRPAINISWYDAKAYIDWLNSWSDGGFRLPSEAEWEYACRAGTTTSWSFDGGQEQLGEYAWFDGNSERKTHPVGEKLPNGFDLHDMHGNVWEWVEDPWHGTYKGAPDDGSVWSADDDTSRVVRGGSWVNHPDILRSAIRSRYTPTLRNSSFGFRLARTVFTS